MDHPRYILPPLLRSVLTLGIYCLPSCDWFSREVYTASPPVIGYLVTATHPCSAAAVAALHPPARTS
eukprot:5507930-Pyramimonas_sp.AAC.1